MGSSPRTSNIIEKGVYTYLSYIIFVYIDLYFHQEIDMALDRVSISSEVAISLYLESMEKSRTVLHGFAFPEKVS